VTECNSLEFSYLKLRFKLELEAPNFTFENSKLMHSVTPNSGASRTIPQVRGRGR